MSLMSRDGNLVSRVVEGLGRLITKGGGAFGPPNPDCNEWESNAEGCSSLNPVAFQGCCYPADTELDITFGEITLDTDMSGHSLYGFYTNLVSWLSNKTIRLSNRIPAGMGARGNNFFYWISPLAYTNGGQSWYWVLRAQQTARGWSLIFPTGKQWSVDIIRVIINEPGLDPVPCNQAGDGGQGALSQVVTNETGGQPEKGVFTETVNCCGWSSAALLWDTAEIADSSPPVSAADFFTESSVTVTGALVGESCTGCEPTRPETLTLNWTPCIAGAPSSVPLFEDGDGGYFGSEFSSEGGWSFFVDVFLVQTPNANGCGWAVNIQVYAMQDDEPFDEDFCDTDAVKTTNIGTPTGTYSNGVTIGTP